MRSVLKALLYAALVAACYWCGFSAYGDYSLLMSDDGDDLARRSRTRSAATTSAPPKGSTTNAPNVTLTATNSSAANPAAAKELAALRQGRRAGGWGEPLGGIGAYLRLINSSASFRSTFRLALDSHERGLIFSG